MIVNRGNVFLWSVCVLIAIVAFWWQPQLNHSSAVAPKIQGSESQQNTRLLSRSHEVGEVLVPTETELARSSIDRDASYSDRWEEIEKVVSNSGALWNLKSDLVEELAMKLPIDEVIDFISERAGPGHIRSNLVGVAFGHSSDTDANLVNMMEELPFPDERVAAGDAIWNDQGILPATLLDVEAPSREGLICFASSLSLYANNNGNESLNKVRDWWEMRFDEGKIDEQIVDVFVSGIEDQYPNLAKSFRDRYPKMKKGENK